MSIRSLISAAGLALVTLALPAAPAFAEAKVSFSQAQVDRGLAEYRRSCTDCHGAELDDGEFGGAPLRGSMFRDKWFGGTVDFLYDFMKHNMPPDRPAGLTDQTYADLLAYILSRNGISAGGAELPTDPEKQAELVIE
jgi:mono/diheme cytochrome c family protein